MSMPHNLQVELKKQIEALFKERGVERRDQWIRDCTTPDEVGRSWNLIDDSKPSPYGRVAMVSISWEGENSWTIGVTPYEIEEPSDEEGSDYQGQVSAAVESGAR